MNGTEPSTRPCPERALAHIRALADARHALDRELAAAVAGVRLALDLPDGALLDLAAGVFLLPADATEPVEALA